MESATRSNALKTQAGADSAPRPPVSLEKFLRDMGVSHVTGWRLRRKGILRTVNLCGRHYVPADAIVEFNDRLARGEFAKVPSRPGPKKAKVKRAARRA